MPKLNGLEVLARVVEFDPAIDVILMTAHYTTETGRGSDPKRRFSDYLNKPISTPRAARSRGEAAGGRSPEAAGAGAGQRAAGNSPRFEGMIGRSPLMWDLFARIRRVAPHYRSALITGPTGTGKELVARALHKLSPAVRPVRGTATVRRWWKRCSKASCSATSRARSPERRRQDGFVGVRARRNAVPGRDRRHAAEHAGQAAAGFAESGSARGWVR